MDAFLWAGLGTLAIFISWKVTQALNNKEILETILDSIREKGLRKKATKYLEAIDMLMDSMFPEANKTYKRYSVFFNIGLYTSIIPFIVEMLDSDPAERRTKTVVGMMIGEKIRQGMMAQMWLIASIGLSFLCDFWFETGAGVWTLLISSISLLAIQIDHKLIEHRIKKGLYGSNAFETLEIVNFIIRHANKDDFNDQGGLKRIIPKPEIITEHSKIPAHTGAYS